MILQPPRSAASNAQTTDATTNGVSRDHKVLPVGYAYTSKDPVEIAANQYRGAILSGSETEEYLIWAATSANLTLRDDPAWSIFSSTPSESVFIPTGSETTHLIVSETRGISQVRLITIVRGDTGAAISVGPDSNYDFVSQDSISGVVVLSAAALVDLAGGVSNLRGDRITVLSYIPATPRFWWSRNDSHLTRFGWNGQTNRWEPLKGTTRQNVGPLKNTPVTLTPKPSRFSVGDTLPGDTTNPDTYAIIRTGTTIPEVEVVSDADAATTYTFAGATPDAILGVTNGILQFNPAFITLNAGQTIWYTQESYPNGDGDLGSLVSGGPWYMAPVPGPQEYPFIRLGSRRYMTAVGVDDDADLATLVVNEGEVGWSKTTGKIKLSQVDIDKADPDAAGFDVQYLGDHVYFDGVSLADIPLRVRQAVPLVGVNGDPDLIGTDNSLYIPDAEPLSNNIIGLGASGVWLVPDGTGTIPDPLIVPGTRPNGSGLVRQIPGIGDGILFTISGVLEEIEVVEFESELPSFSFRIQKGKGYVARELGLQGSLIALSRKDRSRFLGEQMYFLQADTQPAYHARYARLYSRLPGHFTLDGTETLDFAVDGTTYTWSAAGLGAGTFSATDIAAAIDATITGTGQAYAVREHIVLEAGNLLTGSVEIGLTTAVGFLPGWRVDNPGTTECWLSDNGSTLGLFRTPLDLDRTQGTPDFQIESQFNSTLAQDVPVSPIFPVLQPPLQDRPGFDAGVFFTLQNGRNTARLQHPNDVYYDFANNRFYWVEQDTIAGRLEQVTTDIPLGKPGVLGQTIHPAVNADNGLYMAETGSVWTLLTTDEYLVPANGAQGIVSLVEVVGAEVTSGFAAVFSQAVPTLEDANATFVSSGVVAGYRLKVLSGDSAGSYIVVSVTSETELEVDVPFPSNSSFESWQIFEGQTTDVYDPAIVADVQYVSFNHLQEEPFKIRLLESLGLVPADKAAQAISRLVAQVTEAYQRGRETSLRFGLASGSPTATLTALVKGVELGVLTQGLIVPSVTAPHFTDAAFSIRVGSKPYTIGTDLTGVNAFTTPLPGDVIEYGNPGSAIEGELNFGADVLSELSEALVYYDETFTDPDDLAQSQAEYAPATGEINLSTPDMTAYGTTTTAYFVERLITEKRLDVTISPLNGSFYFERALRAGQLVEAEYYQADANGDQIGSQIIEFLPVHLRLETATRVSDYEYHFNAAGRTVSTLVTPYVWVDNNLQNFGNKKTASVTGNKILFTTKVSPTAVVQINYGVLEALGGEQAYNTSKMPVWRPSFYLEAGQNTFTLEGDATGLEPGMLLRVGATPLYIKSLAVTTDTEVTVWPTPEKEVGSRAPGNDLLALYTSKAVTTSVDGVATGGEPGYLLTLVAGFEPVDKGMLSIIFHGDVTRFAVPGHLLEIGGYPLLIVGSKLAEDGRTTRVEVSNPVPTGLNASSATVKISSRPIYPPEPNSFLGIYPFIESEDYELVLFTQGEPGQTLQRGVEYQVNGNNGNIHFLQPNLLSLASNQKLLFNYTRRKTVQPILQDGAVIYPRYKVGYSHISPLEENAGTLLGRYWFRNPDSFYYRAIPLTDYMGEVAEGVVDRLEGQNPSGGPVVATFAGTENHTQGRLGLWGEGREFRDEDRVARSYIETYNNVIVGFEQVLEAINGGYVGDRDGRFRFYIGHDKTYAPPGYEDEITGDINIRLVWSEVFLAANESFGVTISDPIVDPETATQDTTTLVVSGRSMDPNLLRFYINQQKPLINNDMDDVVLAGIERNRLTLGFPLPTMTVCGDFEEMWEPHRLSRLFPEQGLAFTTTYPGIQSDLDAGDAGVYTFAKIINPPKLVKQDPPAPLIGSTFNKPIGVVENPAWGVFSNITDASPKERLPRARIWAYSATGFPELDALAAAVPGYVPTAGFATLIASVISLREVPVDPDTGYPDWTVFISQGGTLADIQSGDAELSTPGFQAEQQVSIGKPSGETFALGNGTSGLNTLFGTIDIAATAQGIFTGVVQLGCVIILADEAGNSISGADILRVGTDGFSGSPVEISQGDTVFIIPPGNSDVASTMANPPAVEDLESFSENLPLYRRGFDVGVIDGVFKDLSLPSWDDPSFPIKEMVGQKTPPPVSTLEAEIEFTNNQDDPFQFPALVGQDKNDNGDYTIPYLGTSNTELDRLGELQARLNLIIYTDGPAPTATQLWLSVYPDEILGSDGVVLGAATATQPPATLLTARNLLPVGVGPYVPNSGVGDVRPYDLLVIERPSPLGPPPFGLPIGSTGVLAVGDVAVGQIEPPRFITQTFVGDVVHYSCRSAMTHLTSTGVSGMEITAIAVGPNTQTILDISSIAGSPVFDDGSATSVGGLNNILGGAGNVLVIRLYSNVDGSLVETIVLNQNTCWGGLGNAPVFIAPIANHKDLIVITTAPFVSNTGVIYDFTIEIDTFITPDTDALTGLGVGTGTGTTTAWVGPNRLTFSEACDFDSMAPRGMRTAMPSALLVETLLSVYWVTASGVTTVAVNNPASVNFGLGLSFLPRTIGGGVGTWTPATAAGAGDELGTVKAMAWEGHLNAALTGTGIVFSAIPSSEIDENGVILNGIGRAEDGSGNTYIHNVVAGGGALDNVVPGDIVAITKSATGDAAIKAGTYLVRHSIDDNTGLDYYETVLAGSAGNRGTWAEILFPKIIAYALGTLTVEVDDTSGPGPGDSAWQAAGRLYAIINRVQVVSMAYNLAGNTFTLTTGTGQDATGAAIADTDFFDLLSEGMLVSGMSYVPVDSGLARNNVVGFDSGATTAGGFLHLTVSNYVLTGDATLGFTTWTYGGVTPIVIGIPAAGEVGVVIPAAEDSRAFYPDEDAIVFNNVATYMDISQISAAQWDAIHTQGAGTTLGVVAVLPADRFCTTDTIDIYGNDAAGTPGFQAQSGVFLEPSFPRPTRNLNQVVPHVVDDEVIATNVEYIGMREANIYGLPTTYEEVDFEVRRIRRFHQVQEDVTDNLSALRFTYETRTGTVASYAGLTLTAAGTGTQLGGFDNLNVNINPGDVVRLLNVSGEMVDSAEIASVLSATQVLLRAPGFTGVVPAPGNSFEIYLKTPPVPHEQSNDQLFGYMVDEVLYSVVPAYATADGGFVPNYNELEDTTGPDYVSLGIQPGDYVIIDPAGELEGATGAATPVEYGSRPLGDQSVPDRGPGLPYVAGQPSELDDNRGFYRIVDVVSDTLFVTGASVFSGEVDSDVIFGALGEEYCVLPSIHNSSNPNPLSFTGDTEGQQDLRTTAPADGSNSFRGNQFSVEPFGYRIIRPSPLFSQETVETVLFIRERMLSWIEELNTGLLGYKSGSYFVFQRGNHSADLGVVTDPASGLGVMHNSYVVGLQGLVDYTPFTNVSDCLSVLDRRYWGLDYRLDGTYSSFETTGSGRPVLPDRIDDILDLGDRLRLIRYAWIRLRSNREFGTLQQIKRFLAELPKRLADRRVLLRIR